MCSSRAVQRANSQLSPRSRAVGSFIPPGSSRHFRSSGGSSSGRLLQPVRAPPARHAAAPVPPARSPAQPQPPPLPAAAARSPAPRRSDAPGAAPHRGGQERRERARRPRPTQRLRRPRIGRRGAEGAGRCGPPEPCPPEVGERGWPCRRAEASGSGARREGSRAGCDLRAGPRRTCAGSGADGERGAVGARRFCAVGALGSAAPVSPVERHRVRAWRLAPLLSRPPGDERSEVVRRMGVVVITASARVAFVASTRVLRLCVLWERLQSLQGPKLEVVQRLLLFRFDYRLWQLKNQRCEVKHKENISVSIGVFFLEKKKCIYMYTYLHKNDKTTPQLSLHWKKTLWEIHIANEQVSGYRDTPCLSTPYFSVSWCAEHCSDGSSLPFAWIALGGQTSSLHTEGIVWLLQGCQHFVVGRTIVLQHHTHFRYK